MTKRDAFAWLEEHQGQFQIRPLLLGWLVFMQAGKLHAAGIGETVGAALADAIESAQERQ